MAISLATLKGLSMKQKVVATLLIGVILAAIFIYFIYLPKAEEMVRLSGEIEELSGRINVHRAKAARLDVEKREHELFLRQLAQLKEQLPPEAEVEVLLKQVSELGIRTGLDFKLWRPVEKIKGPEGLYTEIPINVEVGGSYHALGVFFDKISKLPRIVTVSNLTMSSPQVERERILIATIFVATAFASAAESAALPQAKQ